MKILWQSNEGSLSSFKKIWLIMKLNFFLILLTVLQLSANVSAQNTRLDLKMKNATIAQIFDEIERQSEVYFFYNKSQIDENRTISVDYRNKTIDEILKAMVSDLNLTYEIAGKNIIIKAVNPAGNGFQQSGIKVKGAVKNASGESLPGVTVLVKGTTNGTITDTDGVYNLTNVPGDATLVFSFVGMKKIEIGVAGKSTIDAVLEDETIGLDEVVAVGYGVMRKKDVTGAMASIGTDKVDKGTVKSVDQMLQGRSSGVYMVQSSGMPGAASTVRIRGGNSISGGNEPLYVIDGIPIYPSASSSQTSLSPLNTIAVSDIESIEILKDASSTAIYGARGANGVILVTTKHGKSGRTNVSFDTYLGLQSPRKTYDLLNASEYEKFVNEAEVNGGGKKIYDETVTPVNTDWQDLCLNTKALSQNYALTISGGDAKTRFLTTVNYIDQTGIIKATDLQKLTLRVNLDKEITSKLKLAMNISLAQVNTNRAGNSVLGSMVTASPNIPIYNEDGSYTNKNMIGETFSNPVAVINDYINWNKTFRTLSNASADWRIIDGLTLKSTLGVDLDFGDQQSYSPMTTTGGQSTNGDANVSSSKTYMWVNENTLTYEKTLGKHRINVLAGLTQQTSKYQSLGAESQQFLNDNLAMYDLSSGTVTIPSTTSTTEWSLLSYLGRINYNYNEKYLTTVSLRADGSSRFGKNNRWGYFPSAAFAWRASEEEFVKSLGIFSNLKVRLSYGWTGNQDGIGIYPSMALLGKKAYALGETKYMGYGPTQVANYNLKWETTAQSDLGIEMGFFDNKVNLSADLYYKKTHDLLLRTQIPSTSGYNSGLKNIGEVENRGLELSLNVVPVNRRIRWEADLNVTFNRNKVISLGEVNSIIPSSPGETSAGLNNSRLLQVGEPLGIFYGYVGDGVFGTNDNIAASAQPTAKPGDIRFKDISGPNGVPDNIISDYDRQIIGCAQPKFYGGITNTFTYKNFDLSIFMVWSYGNDIYNATKADMEGLQGSINQFRSILNRWTPDNQNTNIPRAVNVKLTSRSWDYLIEDGSFLRVQNINLGYKLPESLISGSKIIRSARIYTSLQNFLTFTNYSGLDPEVSKYGQDNLGMGYDYYAYPMSKTVLLGLTVNF